MARIRLFRLYGKKRGDRRTGSPALASAGEALFFGFFLALGTFLLLWLLFRWVIPEWHVLHGFVPAKCQILGESIDGQSGRKVLARETPDQILYRPNLRIGYEVSGQKYEAWTYDITDDYTANKSEAEAILAQFEEGKEYPCWYDPQAPQHVVLVRGLTWWLWIVMLLPVSFIVIGGAGLIYTLFHWGKTIEHRSAAARHVASLNPLQNADVDAQRYPHVPHAANLTNSPGTTLTYRLPISTSPGWRAFALGAACTLWNAVVIMLLVLYLTGAIVANPAWAFWVLLLVAIPAGWGLVFLFVRDLLLTSGVGPTLVEISDHPLIPGHSYEVFLSQIGKLSLKSFALLLVCDEEATYRQGTDTRSDRLRVFEERIWSRETFEIEQGLPFEVRCPLRLPADSMHSFKADFNEVQWKLLVKGDAEGWPPFERVFPLVVYPRREGGVA